PILAPHDEVAAGVADVDAVVGVGGVGDDPLLFFVEGIHGPPPEHRPAPEPVGIVGPPGVLPGRPRFGSTPRPRARPRRRTHPAGCRGVSPPASRAPAVMSPSGK